MWAQLDLLRTAASAVQRDNSGRPTWGEEWLALQHMCPDASPGAADIVDSKIVTRVVSRKTRREYFLVEGSTAGTSRTKAYICLPGFCTCDFYHQKVSARPDALVCKHELAVMLATVLAKVQDHELEEEEWKRAFDLSLSLEFPQHEQT